MPRLFARLSKVRVPRLLEGQSFGEVLAFEEEAGLSRDQTDRGYPPASKLYPPSHITGEWVLPRSERRSDRAEVMPGQWERSAWLFSPLPRQRPDALTLASFSTPAPRAVVLWLHGGAYCFLSASSHRNITVQLANRAQVRVLAINYRLAPADPFPAGLDDALTTYRWLTEYVGLSPSLIFIAGDSAGGALALSTLQRLRTEELPMPAGAIVVSPWLDLTLASEGWADSMRTPDYLPAGSHTLVRQCIDAYAGATLPTRENYASDADFAAALASYMAALRAPLLSPMYMDLKGLPPILMHVGAAERLSHDARLFRDKAIGEDFPLEYEEYKNQVHVFTTFNTPEAYASFDSMRAFLRQHLPEDIRRRRALQREQHRQRNAARSRL